MEELSEFYDSNINDPYVHFFEKLRLKLKKALHFKVGMREEQVDFRDVHRSVTPQRD